MPIPDGFYTVPTIGRFGAWRANGRHAGLDQYAPEGTASGLEQAATILAKGSNLDPTSGFGHWVRYVHDDGHTITEAHFMAPSPLERGRRYEADTLVGRTGDTGNAGRVGPHVHVEVRHPDGHLIDPAIYLARFAYAGTPEPTREKRYPMFSIVPQTDGRIMLQSLVTGNETHVRAVHHVALLQRFRDNDSNDTMLPAEVALCRQYVAAIAPDKGAAVSAESIIDELAERLRE